MIDDRELLEMIKVHEGYSSKPYLCTAGKLTIGYGHNLDDRGITQDIAEQLLRGDIGIALQDLYVVFPELNEFTKQRQYALIDMMFNLGLTNFNKFRKMIAAVKLGLWNVAADEMKDSDWYKQVGNRAIRLESMMRVG